VKKGTLIFVIAVVMLLIGIAIPKLTVHDAVALTDAEKNCAYGIFTHIADEGWLDRVALMLGKGTIIEKQGPTDFGGKAYTIFRIPIGILHGQADESYGISCLLPAPAGVVSTTSGPIITPADLTDGERVEWLGVYHASDVIVNGMKSYISDTLGMSLKYPDGYLLFDNEGGEGASAYHSLVIGPDGPMRETIARAAAGFAGEGPESIVVSFYNNPTSLSLEAWLRAHEVQSNFHPSVPSDPSLNAVLTPTTVGGVSAFKYHSALGLYDSDYVAFQYKDWIVIASSASDLSKDFNAVLTSIQLKK